MAINDISMFLKNKFNIQKEISNSFTHKSRQHCQIIIEDSFEGANSRIILFTAAVLFSFPNQE